MSPAHSGVTVSEWAAAFLAQLGHKPTTVRLSAMIAWAACEGGGVKNHAYYNPLNTTRDAVGAVSVNRCGVKAYQTMQQGMMATVQTLNLAPYWKVRAALQGFSDADAILAVVSASPWGTHPHYHAAALQAYGAQYLLERPDHVDNTMHYLPTLRQGARGADVELLQSTLVLRLATAARLRVDGIYGPNTRAAVMRFQQSVDGLRVDGVVGPATWTALGLAGVA